MESASVRRTVVPTLITALKHDSVEVQRSGLSARQRARRGHPCAQQKHKPLGGGERVMESQALITWTQERVDAGLPTVESLTQPAWLDSESREGDGWSLVCRFPHPPSEQGNPTWASVSFLFPEAPSSVMRPGNVLHLFDGFAASTARVLILEDTALFPGLELNALETAVLRRTCPDILEARTSHRVIRRDLTGVGSFTFFEADLPPSEPGTKIRLNGLIQLPGIDHGLGATLLLHTDEGHCLEVYSFGEEHWDGTADGFGIVSDEGPAS